MSRRRLVAAVGDVRDRGTWSGIPYHLFKAGHRARVIDDALELDASSRRITFMRWMWNARALVRGGTGGFQYSPEFLEALWSGLALESADVINCFQLYPPSLVGNPQVRKWYFIDQTLKQLFEYYEESARVPRATRERAMALERRGYRAAIGVIANSEWARASVVHDYDTELDKTHVVVPGPSLDERLLEDHMSAPGPSDGLRIAFVGKDWRRKGLDRLIHAVEIARAQGESVSAVVIGATKASLPQALRSAPGIEWAGFVDKATDQKRFIDLLAACDLGCLLSRQEAGGIALREYHAVGLPVIAPDTGGAPEHTVSDAAILVAPERTPEEIASVLVGLCRDPDRLANLRARAQRARNRVSWTPAITQLGRILDEHG